MARIVVVDDSRCIRLFIEQALRSAGHEVWTAQDGAEGLALLDRGPVDAVLTDIYMPEKDGLELILALRRRPRPPGVIAMSSNTVGPKNMLQAARQFGARTVLHKPFTPERLLAAVAKVLSGEEPDRAR